MLNTGDVLENWEIAGKLGEGGMGAVYRAQNRVVSDMQAAIKVSRPTDFKQARARFEREVKALLRLQHPSVVRIQGVGEDSERGLLWFAMDLVEGQPLEDLFDHGALPLDQALPLFIALCDGLAHAHARGVAHRDLKPANIIVRPSGEPVLVDFGISAAVDADKLTRTGMVVGTPQYLPPEALDGMITDPSRGDIYAIGQMLVEALDGESAFPFDPNMTSTQNALRIMHRKVAAGPITPKTGVPPTLRAIIAKATEPDPQQRLATITELAEGLREVAESRGIATWGGPTIAPMTPPTGTAMPTMELSTTETPVPERKKGGGGLLALGAGAVVLVVLMIVLLLGGGAVAAVAGYYMLAPQGDAGDADPLAAAVPVTDMAGAADLGGDEPVDSGSADPEIQAAGGTSAGSERPTSGERRAPATGSTEVEPDGAAGSATAVEPATDGGTEAEPSVEAEPGTDPTTDGGAAAEPEGTEPEAEGTEAAPDGAGAGAAEPPDDGTPDEPDPAVEAAPAVTSFRPDWSSIVGIRKGMSDNQLEALLGPSTSGSKRHCRGGEGGRAFRSGTITVCRGLVGGARRVYVSSGVVNHLSGLPADPKIGVLGKDKATAIQMIGAPGSDRGDALPYNHNYARLYLGGDKVIGIYAEL